MKETVGWDKREVSHEGTLYYIILLGLALTQIWGGRSTIPIFFLAETSVSTCVTLFKIFWRMTAVCMIVSRKYGTWVPLLWFYLCVCVCVYICTVSMNTWTRMLNESYMYRYRYISLWHLKAIIIRKMHRLLDYKGPEFWQFQTPSVPLKNLQWSKIRLAMHPHPTVICVYVPAYFQEPYTNPLPTRPLQCNSGEQNRTCKRLCAWNTSPLHWSEWGSLFVRGSRFVSESHVGCWSRLTKYN